MFRGSTSKKNHAAANMVSAPPANPRGTRFAGGMGSDQAFVREMVLVLVVLVLKGLLLEVVVVLLGVVFWNGGGRLVGDNRCCGC